MHFDQSQEWLRLAGEYRARSDEELRELYRDLNDLTEVAKQALRAELQSRGLDTKIAEQQQAAASSNDPWAKRAASSFGERAQISAQGRALGGILGSDSADQVSEETKDNSASDEPVEYSWKTILCECEEREQAYQIYEVLKRSGIESWIQSRGSGLLYTRVLVAADELEQAQAVVANPIPQVIIDESRETVPEYELPRCPGCGAEDPVLESAEPVNSWKCDVCGREWTDPAEESQPAGPFT